MPAKALAGRLRRLLPPSRSRVPAGPPYGEVAAASIAGRLQPYIGELPLNPRQPSRYADRYRDEGATRSASTATSCGTNAARPPSTSASTPPSRGPGLQYYLYYYTYVEPGGDGAQNRAAADDLARQLAGVGFDAVCRQLLHGVWYGYAIAEALWARDAERVVLDRLVVRAPDRFRWSAEGEPLLRTDAHPLGAPLPEGKFVVLRRPGEHGDLPHGAGLARWCFWPVWLKRHGLKFWSVALEKFGAPGVKGTYPRNASAEQKADLLDLVQSFATSLGVILPEGQEIEIVESARRAGGDFQAFVAYLDRAIATTILGQSSHHRHGALARHGGSAARRARRDRRRRLPPARRRAERHRRPLAHPVELPRRGCAPHPPRRIAARRPRRPRPPRGRHRKHHRPPPHPRPRGAYIWR